MSARGESTPSSHSIQQPQGDVWGRIPKHYPIQRPLADVEQILCVDLWKRSSTVFWGPAGFLHWENAQHTSTSTTQTGCKRGANAHKHAQQQWEPHFPKVCNKNAKGGYNILTLNRQRLILFLKMASTLNDDAQALANHLTGT